MPRHALALLALALPATVLPAAAQAQSRPQYQARVRAEFARADRNRDGQLDRGEVTAAVVRAYGARGMTTGRSRILTNHYFQRLDLNRDNAVTPREAQGAAADAFRRFDANRDGRLDPRERAAMGRFLRNPAR